jgi:hypothetical protein
MPRRAKMRVQTRGVEVVFMQAVANPRPSR